MLLSAAGSRAQEHPTLLPRLRNGLIAVFVVGVPASTLFSNMKNTRAKHIIGGSATVFGVAMMLLLLLNNGIGYFLDWYDFIVSAPRALVLLP